MKSTLLILATILTTTTAKAEIINSEYDVRHQALLERAIFDACGVGQARLTQLSSTEIEHHVDQGIVDLYFTTKLEMVVKVDQGLYDTYRVTTQSALYSAHDHESHEWGVYAVRSVACELQ